MIILANILKVPSNAYWRNIAEHAVKTEGTSSAFAMNLRKELIRKNKISPESRLCTYSSLMSCFEWGTSIMGVDYWLYWHGIGQGKQASKRRRRML